MSWHLTEGAVATLMQGGAIERPVMQIVDSLRVIDRDHETYQLMVSDGSHMSSMAMLSTQWNVRMRSGQLSLYSVVRVNRFRMINYAEDGDEKFQHVANGAGVTVAAEVPSGTQSLSPHCDGVKILCHRWNQYGIRVTLASDG
ncbi:replication protein A 70 kDa DNA-binding subunit-like isoform X2 [Schistocerca americana]|uniref:replication protein A 70 kDa DNA-binding subunit-like isoform X2 n=1 Tax=Schistocerca americana TaxID=7009 RepID=UPI001F4FECBE|nr:replication protein A 70 kDa DNA-binding subunit-like isoform X2 [Schistocerca americana]